MQGIAIMEPILAKAARKLGVDQVALRRINAPAGKAPFGPLVNGKQAYATSAFVREALDRGSERFKWNERKIHTGKRNGSKVRGIGVAVSSYSGGTTARNFTLGQTKYNYDAYLRTTTSDANGMPPPLNAPKITISTTGKNKLKNTACGLLKVVFREAFVIASIAFH